eukprot:Skav205910  [mRNA]  locus=scaffold123:456554:470116:+ [translate_table: standard]
MLRPPPGQQNQQQSSSGRKSQNKRGGKNQDPGTSMITLARSTRIIRIVRLLRLVRMQEIMANDAWLAVTERIQSEALGPVMQVLMTISHFTGCLWFAIGARDTSETTWVSQGGYTTAGSEALQLAWTWDNQRHCFFLAGSRQFGFGSSDFSSHHAGVFAPALAMRGLAWILCFPALYVADVKLSIATTSTDSKVMVDGKDTGCTSKTTSQDLTCKFQDLDSFAGQVPATFFSAVINCNSMDTSAFDSLTVKPLSECAKMTFTQHMEKGGHVNREILEMIPNSIANFTCVAFPFSSFDARIKDEGWSKLPVNVSITGTKNGQEDKVSNWTMGSVRYHVESGKEAQYGRKCKRVVEENFHWGLSLLKSSQNVHEVLWTSQAKKPTIDHTTKINIYDFNFTQTVKHVAFKDLEPSITLASVSSAGNANFKKHVKIKRLEADQDQPEKHEQKLELSVDATQLPKGTKELEVMMTLVYPTTGYTDVELLLPVDSPEIPDENTEKPTEKPAEIPTENPTEKPKEKEKSGGVGVGVIAFITVFGAGLVVLGAFLYRRHQVIQAHETEVVL